MFKNFKSLSAPFALCATSLILVASMLLPGFSYPTENVSSLSAKYTVQGSNAFVSEETATKDGGAESQAAPELSRQTPGIAGTMRAYSQNEPLSMAQQLANQTPRLRQEIREESVAEEDVESALPVGNMIMYALTDEEYEMLCWCVEGEARGKSLKHKEIIAQVIMNRVFNDRFPNTVKGVLTSPNQFVPMGWFERGVSIHNVSPSTFEAVNAVMDGDVPDMSQGALYFCNPYIAYGVSWFDNALVTLFELESHRFYTTPSGR